MQERLLQEPGPRRRDPQCSPGVVAVGVCQVVSRSRGDELGALLEQRCTEVHVIEVHVRGRVMPLVRDLVLDEDVQPVERRHKLTVEHEVLRERPGLADVALDDDRRRVAVPCRPVSAKDPGVDETRPCRP